MKPETLSVIADYFSRHPDVDAVNGPISKDLPNGNFFSQYNKLDMHFIFRRLPERITFLDGLVMWTGIVCGLLRWAPPPGDSGSLGFPFQST